MSTLYSLLGCDRSASVEQIMSEYRVRVIEVHPDKVQTDSSHQFHQLQYAKKVLTEPSTRRHYDLFLSMGGSEAVGMSLEEWMDNKEKLQQVIHWILIE